ncbi:hypothetical protein B0T12DRAFT_2116 [Alternaria alternata]|nr:hypothetical protein B0T12DRAFT_2116 [Alternaria alternata]
MGASFKKSFVTETETKKLEEYVRGYPRLAAFESSEPSFSLYRKFKYLHSRVLLELQHEIQCLESDLTSMDEMDYSNGKQDILQSIEIDHRQAKQEGIRRKRTKLVNLIRGKLVHYDELLLKSHALNALQQPTDRDYISVRNWFHNERPLASEKEESYIKQREDIVILRHGRQWTRFHGFIEQTIEILNCRPIRNIFRTTELQDRTDDKLIYYYSARRIEILVNIITTGLMLALLVLPPVVLYRTKVGAEEQSTVSVPAIFVGFTCLFAVVMVLILGVNRHELFAAMAVYCAVLAAFVGSTGSGQNCGNCS